MTAPRIQKGIAVHGVWIRRTVERRIEAPEDVVGDRRLRREFFFKVAAEAGPQALWKITGKGRQERLTFYRETRLPVKQRKLGTCQHCGKTQAVWNTEKGLFAIADHGFSQAGFRAGPCLGSRKPPAEQDHTEALAWLQRARFQLSEAIRENQSVKRIKAQAQVRHFERITKQHRHPLKYVTVLSQVVQNPKRRKSLT